MVHELDNRKEMTCKLDKYCSDSYDPTWQGIRIAQVCVATPRCADSLEEYYQDKVYTEH